MLVRRFQPYRILRREHFHDLARYVDHFVVFERAKSAAAAWPEEDGFSPGRKRVYDVQRAAEAAMLLIAQSIGINAEALAAHRPPADDSDGSDGFVEFESESDFGV